MFPKEGKVLSNVGSPHLRATYAMTVSNALQRELGGTHRAAKTIMGWTGTTERTVKNWLAGTSGPAGEHLVLLVSRSDAVFAALMGLARRPHPIPSKTVIAARDALDHLLRLSDVR